jgi:hypothetical protein
MAAEMDKDLLSRVGEILLVTEDPALFTQRPAYAASTAEMHKEAKAAWTELDGAVRAAEDDLTENRIAAIRVTEALSAAVSAYGWVRDSSRRRLLELPPEELLALPAAEKQAREDYLATTFPEPVSVIARLKRAKAADTLANTLRRVKGSEYATADDVARLEQQAQTVAQTRAALLAEKADDAAVAERLFAARVEAQVQVVALRQHVESILRSEHSPLSLDDLVEQAKKRKPTAETAPEEPTPEPTPEVPLS